MGVIWGLRASVFPRALALAVPNAILAFILGMFSSPSEREKELAASTLSIGAFFTSVLFWVLYFRSTVAYNRWWEGGTLLQQTRGEWFNAYSSLIAFTSPDPQREAEVEAYQHMLARLMSLLFCSALQQVSPNRKRPFEIIDSTGIDPRHLQFLDKSNDRVEVILQWVQRSTILNMGSGVLPIPPPVMSRAFQEISRGIVNLQNARKIADFPFPFPYAQTSLVMLLIHWVMCPIITSMLLNSYVAAGTCFVVVFFVWCTNFIAQELESPFGTDDNDLPMDVMQADWNKSLATLLHEMANKPPRFKFDPQIHRDLNVRMSDGTSARRSRVSLTGTNETDERLWKPKTTPWSGVFGDRRKSPNPSWGESQGSEASCKSGRSCERLHDVPRKHPSRLNDVGYRSENSDTSHRGNGQTVVPTQGDSNDHVHMDQRVMPDALLPVASRHPPDCEVAGARCDVSPTNSQDEQGQSFIPIVASSSPAGHAGGQGGVTAADATAIPSRMSASQVTAAALASPRSASSSKGSATTRSAVSALDLSRREAQSTQSTGPEEVDPQHNTGFIASRLGLHCPGIECLSPFNRPKKPRSQQNKGRQNRSILYVAGDDVPNE